jgi:hypothetical protein
MSSTIVSKSPTTSVLHSSASTGLDPKALIQLLAEYDLTIKQSSSLPELFLTVQELESGSITEDEFMSICKPLVSVITGFDGSVIDAVAGLGEGAKQIRVYGEAWNLQARCLSAFETANALEPESVKIVLAVKEVVEDSFNDHEVVYLQADSLSIRDFLREETVLFLTELGKRGADNVSMSLIRRKRAELKEKLEFQRKNAMFTSSASRPGLRT